MSNLQSNTEHQELRHNLRQIEDAHDINARDAKKTTALEFGPPSNQPMVASSSEPTILQGINQQMGQGSQGSGNGSQPSSTDENTYGKLATDDKEMSDAAQSYEMPTQRFDKLKNVQSNATGGNKSTTTGMSAFGGQSEVSEPGLSINEEAANLTKKQSQNLQMRPDTQRTATTGTGSNRTRTMSAKYSLKQKQKQIFEALTSFDINKLKVMLQRVDLQDSLSLPELYDEDGHNLLHRAAYDNTFRISEFLITYFKQRLAQNLKILECERQGKSNPEQLNVETINNIKCEVRTRVAYWINTPSKSEQGFYPLHFASFHGNIQLIKLLMRNKADYTVQTNEGINMLHVAAQGDQAYSLTYFKSKGLSIMSKDKERSTPLHWACCAGSDTASYYLQSWGVNVNAVDFLGYTPLHLAVRYSNRFPNTRTIKELLIKGADRDATERSGLKPIDLVETLEDNEIKEELKQLLVKPTIILPCCHFRTPMVKIDRTNKCVALFLGLMLCTFIANMVFVYPYIYADGWFPILFMIFTGAMIFFGLTVKVDPGYMQGRSTIPFVRLVEKFEANLLCPHCEVICTADSRHCYTCNQCVERYDHHCQWVNNCIGIGNHSYFYLFIMLQDLYLILVVVMALFNIDMVIEEETLTKARQTVLVPGIVNSDTITAQIMFDFSLIVAMMLSLFFSPFLSYLVFIQTQNFMLNQTTNTRYSKHRKENASEQAIAALADYEPSDVEDDDILGQPYQTPQTQRARTSRLSTIETPTNQGCMGNCGNMFCGPGHFRKQERIMRKFIDDPNMTVNQEASGHSSGIGAIPSGETPLPVPGSVGQNMQHSYNKRQMFAYGVEDSATGQPLAINGSTDNSNPLHHAQQMAAALENASPKAVRHSHDERDDGQADANFLLRQP